ncbi:MAG: hypothetical protein A9183_05655 [Dehalococcoides mccartyi]|uniref:histidine kinase n=1 Tax=Dehalococcoides mccartyi TaxID=61435 RepID=A0A2J1E064_9CHLR|nr:PAS domain-containing sensor histidine kinase [Dehalococcoides mccartyi]OBW62792.1 MAG: hypothetical protein A9183_05655 [Dehalococcoides mccartyi]PKH47823.1 PAS domain-containing sensor histidine kinase [Dehalococcoides mccartyi]
MFNKYKRFFDNAYDGFAILDLSLPFEVTRHLDVNQQFCDMLGYTKREVLDLGPIGLIHPNSRETVRMHLQGHYNKTQSQSFMKSTFIRKDGTEISLESKLFSEKTKSYHIVFGVHRDVTKKYYMEKTIKEQLAKEAALRKELEAQATEKSNYIRLIVHELKTPITALLAAVELSKQNPGCELPELSLDNIYDSVIALDKRVDDLSNLAKSQMNLLKIRPVMLNLADLTNQIVNVNKPSFQRKGQIFNTDIQPDLPNIYADKECLFSILMNLLSNAGKYCGKDGKISLNIKQFGDDILFEIADNGIGIDPNNLERIFDPYDRIKRISKTYSGLGLGLFLSKTFIELHGGKIWVDSVLGMGSKFSFTIPNRQPPQSVEE